MNKILFFILLLAISFGYIFDIDKVIARNFTPFTSLKTLFLDISQTVSQKKEIYFNQIDAIKYLLKENEELKNYKIKYEASQNELDAILNTFNNSNTTTDSVRFARVLSYVDFDDFTKVWLDMKKDDDSILGVISENYASGIVVNQYGRAKALLNGNEKCNYAIFIGDSKAPGIIHASDKMPYLKAKFVPIWFDIKEGDEVITSGMDNIFFEGLKVGKVVSIEKMQDIQEAIIMPYAQVQKQTSFFIYENIKKEAKENLANKKNLNTNF